MLLKTGKMRKKGSIEWKVGEDRAVKRESSGVEWSGTVANVVTAECCDQSNAQCLGTIVTIGCATH